MTFLVILIGFSVAIALPALRRDPRILAALHGLTVTFFAVTVPLLIFLASGLLVPEWKGACPHGWIDCFYTGKLMLTPFVLWATAALYSIEILRVEPRDRAPIVLGIFIGAVVSGVCLLIGLFFQAGGLGIFLLIPAYVFIWYLIRAAQLMRISTLSIWAYLITLASSIPFWAAAIWWMKHIYRGLPDKAPDCFIVTAAGQGHRGFVGPFFDVEHNGRRRQANRQLITLWQLESLWRARSPRSHKTFRFVYNRIGPVVAARIRSPWLADAAYVAIKPVELTAYWINQTWRKS